MNDKITIVGAGLVGSLLGVLLAKKGHKVTLVERRPDMRTAHNYAGRSINLALSHRGLLALREAGIADQIQEICIPMYGRTMHALDGTQTYLQYGAQDQAINSVSRGDLNKALMTCAEEHGVEIQFNRRCTDIELNGGSATFFNTETGTTSVLESDVVFGADGAFSAVRDTMVKTDRFNYSQQYLPHGYKELHIPSGPHGEFLLEKNSLHIWPRKSYMMIALPNPDGSFTCTLFFAHEGSPSFAELTTPELVRKFFIENFADAVPLMPTLVEDFFTNPESSLVTVKCFPWVINNIALIGDAAHAIVPFYGQGMNCGFEDCRILMACYEHEKGNWASTLQHYQRLRKPSGDAIAELALDNFIEMRDKVADPQFLLRKSIEGYIHSVYPNKHIPLYSLVTFMPEVPYQEAQRLGMETDALMAKILQHPEVQENWKSDASKSIIDAYMASKADITIASGLPQ